MKIAINAWFYNQINTGSGQYLRYLIPALTDLDPALEVVLIVPASVYKSGELAWSQKLQRVYLEPVTVGASNFGKVYFEQVLFPRQAKALGAQVAHVPYFGSALFPLLPTVVTVHDLIPVVLPAYRGHRLVRLYTKLVSRAAHKASLILGDSDASRHDILDHLTVPAERVRTVYLAQAPHYRPARNTDQLNKIRQKI